MEIGGDPRVLLDKSIVFEQLENIFETIRPTTVFDFDREQLLAMGELLEIWLKKLHGEPMISLTEADVIAGEGIAGSAKEPGTKRQVTVLSKESWESATESIGKFVNPKERRANFIVSGIDLEETIGKILQIGELKIEVTGETVPCKLMNEVSEGLRDALTPEWRGGITGVVINDCSVKKGDLVKWL